MNSRSRKPTQAIHTQLAESPFLRSTSQQQQQQNGIIYKQTANVNKAQNNTLQNTSFQDDIMFPLSIQP